MRTEPIRVLHLIKGLGRGGAERLLSETLRFCNRRRFSYAYGYLLPRKDALVHELSEQNAPVTCFKGSSPSSMPRSAARIAKHLRASKADVLHCHLPVAGILGRIAGRMAGVPVVYTEHNVMEHYHSLTRRLNLWTWGMQCRVIAVSTDVAASIERHAGQRVRVDVVLNGVDTERFRRDRIGSQDLRRRLGIPADAPVIGTVAVFRPQKRLQDWLHAAVLLRNRLPNAQFLLIGDGQERDHLRRLAARSGLDGALHMPGLQDDVRPFLAAMDVFMLSSSHEGLPVALLEAMSMRCAVVSTAVGGVLEAVRDGESGVLVEPRKPEALAAAAAATLSDPERQQSLGDAARRRVEERFSIARMAARLEEIYTEVVEQAIDAR